MTTPSWRERFDEKFNKPISDSAHRHLNSPASRNVYYDNTELLAFISEVEAEAYQRGKNEAVIGYHELILAVKNKHPNETRHETALRYIRNAEVSGGEAARTSMSEVI